MAYDSFVSLWDTEAGAEMHVFEKQVALVCVVCVSVDVCGVLVGVVCWCVYVYFECVINVVRYSLDYMCYSNNIFNTYKIYSNLIYNIFNLFPSTPNSKLQLQLQTSTYREFRYLVYLGWTGLRVNK